VRTGSLAPTVIAEAERTHATAIAS